MTSNHKIQEKHRTHLDDLVDAVRETQEAFRGPRYWEAPQETREPHDPLPGHAWDCPRRNDLYGRRGPYRKCCSGASDA